VRKIFFCKEAKDENTDRGRQPGFANNAEGKRIAYVTSGFITASVESK